MNKIIKLKERLEEKLRIPALCGGLAGGILHLVKTEDRKIFSPISEHIGDFSLIFTPILASGYLSRIIQKIGEDYNDIFLKKLGKNLPEIVTAGLVAYGTLGESVLNIIPNNTRDIKDIPAVLLAAVCGYIMGKNIQKGKETESYQIEKAPIKIEAQENKTIGGYLQLER